MGDFRSGGWNASGRLTTAQALRLDVNELNRDGALTPGRGGSWHWTRSDEQTGYIFIRAGEDTLTLTYTCSIGGGSWTDHEEHFRISWEPCRFGGRRPFFRCPYCGRRVSVLYGRSRFMCRKCQRLSYPSQRERASARALRKANRIRTRLGGAPGWQGTPPRPKGMHHRTYDRLIGEIAKADAVTINYLVGQLEWLGIDPVPTKRDL